MDEPRPVDPAIRCDPRVPVAVAFDAGVIEELRLVATAALPHEACGLLFGERRRFVAAVAALVTLENLAHDSTRRFTIDPLACLLAIDEGRRDGREFLGFFHSHPAGGAELSAVDRSEGWPHSLQVVVAADDGAVRAHWLSTDGAALPLPTAEDVPA